MTADGRLVFVAKTARTFCYGFLGVLFPVYLAERGMGARQIGVAVTLTLLANQPPIYGTYLPYFRHALYSSRADTPPPEVTDRLPHDWSSWTDRIAPDIPDLGL